MVKLERVKVMSKMVKVPAVMVVVIISLCILLVLNNKCPNVKPEVETKCGIIAGRKEFIKGKTTYTFKGIPYAKPPVGKLRWRAPVPLSDDINGCWEGVYDADTFGTQCVQIGDDHGSEDCLFLNIYTPSLQRKANLPVFFYIHGGNLMSFNGSFVGYTPDSEFAASMDVVAVSVNYRLNAFGFLTLKELWVDGESYGNYGLMDQILALKWIQKNIKNFGGDPNLITIAGQSSGGTSVFGLLASPLADGLFHRAISMSGSPKFNKSYVDASDENRVFLNKTKCKSIGTAADRKGCLYNLTANEILNSIPYDTYPNWAMDDLFDFPTNGLLDGALAVVDPIVIPRPPKDLKFRKYRNLKKVSVLVGNTAQEIGAFPVHDFTKKLLHQYRGFLKKKLDTFSSKHLSVVLDDLYRNISRDHSVEYLHETIASDVRVICPSNALAKDFKSSNHHTVYRYVVEEMPSCPINFWGFPAKYAVHSWDLSALLNFKLSKSWKYTPTPDDLQFVKSIRDNFKHFMKYGHPVDTKWIPGKTGIFKRNGLVDVLSENYHEKQCSFWNDAKNGYVPYQWIN